MLNTGKGRMILPMVALVLLEVTGKTSASGGDGDNAIDYAKLYDTGPGKRAAYSYVSEYKRLPVYNFGLGKRSLADERRLYSFGLGKRSYDAYDDEYDDVMRDDFNKRMKQYSFGLGKRAPKQYSFGLGKRPDGKMYSFGLGKRSLFPYDEYEAASRSLDDDFDNSNSQMDETVKRTAGGPGGAGGGRLYSFGLGKRGRSQDEPRQGRSMMYNFGLGKRSTDAFASDGDSDTSSSAKDSPSSALLVN